MKNYYFVISVFFELESSKSCFDEICHYALNQCDCDGIEELNLSEIEVDTLLGEKSLSGGILNDEVLKIVENKSAKREITKFYFYGEGAEKRKNCFIDYIVKLSLNLNFKQEKLQNEDWNEKWRENYASIEVSESFKVVPSWLKDQDQSTNNIYLYPGMGFGTGEHETTFLCMKLIYDLINSGVKLDKVLDFGCGSGILGLCAIKLNGSKVDFYDVDKDALENTSQNFKINFPSEQANLHLFGPKQKMDLVDKYDLVIANILLDVLLKESDFLVKKIKKPGRIMLSGILVEQERQLFEEYEIKHQLKQIIRVSKGDWCAVVFEAN